MKKTAACLFMVFSVLAVFLFANIEALYALPQLGAEQFLDSMPHRTILLFGRTMIWTQPSSTVIVFLLGLATIGFGVFFLSSSARQQSRAYWGAGMILWGLGALSAGISYQAFGYELKCAGRTLCLFTSKFEIAYLLLTCFSIACFLLSAAYASARGNERRVLIRFAVIDCIVYTALLLAGAILPVRFLISYEGFLLLIGGNFVVMFVFALLHRKKHGDRLSKRMIAIWLAFLLVNIGYFAFLYSGVSQTLYQTAGVWFNENDFFHVLLIGWMLMIFFLLKNTLRDSESNP